MYESLDMFINPCNGKAPKFIQLFKSKWDEIHSKPNVFRYKIDHLKEKIVGDKYLLQLNPDRAVNRRTPELIGDMSQPFNEEKFNFTKVSQEEVMFCIGKKADDPELHSFIVNVSPISRYHALLCPFVNKKLPQAVTFDCLLLAIRVMFLGKDRQLKMGFNSLCALASVNHLHFHLFIENNELAVEKAKWKHIHENVYSLEDYPVPAFCFKIPANFTFERVKEIHSVIKHLQDRSIAHNIFMNLKPTETEDSVHLYVFPRRSTTGVKQFTAFNVAVCELSGWFPVFSEEAFENLNSEDLEKEMNKWQYDDFKYLCKDVLNLKEKKRKKISQSGQILLHN